MIIQREEFYFEPRVIGGDVCLRWYGEKYTDDRLMNHIERTVYIRDNGSELFVYQLMRENLEDEMHIKATFNLICKIKKHSNLFIYGRKNQ